MKQNHLQKIREVRILFINFSEKRNKKIVKCAPNFYNFLKFYYLNEKLGTD